MYQSTIRKPKAKKNNTKRSELPLPDEDEGLCLAVVQSMLGNGRAKVMLPTGMASLGRICGSMRRHKSRNIVAAGSLVLVSNRDFEPDKCDIVHRYSHDEVAVLHRKHKNYFTPILVKACQEHDIGVTYASDEECVVAFEDQESQEDEGDKSEVNEDPASAETDTDEESIDIDEI